MKWNRSHVLNCFDSLMSRAASPWSKAETMEQYSNNGYILLGAVVIALSVFLWSIGWLTGTLGQLPPRWREPVRYFFGLFGAKDLPQAIPFFALIFLLYLTLVFIKPARLWL